MLGILFGSVCSKRSHSRRTCWPINLSLACLVCISCGSTLYLLLKLMQSCSQYLTRLLSANLWAASGCRNLPLVTTPLLCDINNSPPQYAVFKLSTRSLARNSKNLEFCCKAVLTWWLRKLKVLKSDGILRWSILLPNLLCHNYSVVYCLGFLRPKSV